MPGADNSGATLGGGQLPPRSVGGAGKRSGYAPECERAQLVDVKDLCFRFPLSIRRPP